MVSKHFTVKEAIWLPQWNRLANEKEDSLTQDAKDALVKLFTEVMDEVRELIEKPITVHVAFRSPDYNVLIGGARLSIHMARKYDDGNLAAACDWSADMGKGSIGANCDALKEILKPKLESMDIRMEDNGVGASWIHLDDRKPGPGGRFFKP
jgi:phenylpyruvate tautomerase PptA (4-oxalocrotonate tautomerase family)